MWLRGYAPNAAGDSLYVALDDQPPVVLTKAITNSLTQTKYTYSDTAGGRELQTVLAYQQPEAYTTQTRSNGLGEVTRQERDGDGGTIIISRSYDALGRLAAVSAPHFAGESVVSTRYGYDALGRTTHITNTDNTVQVLSYENWDTVTRLDENGRQTKRYSDGLGRLREVHVFTGTTTPVLYSKTKYSYDAKDALSTVLHTDPLDNALAPAVSITINSLGQKTAMNDPDMGLWSYSYDAAGNLQSQTDAIGQVITFTYDAHNRVTSKQYSDGSPAVSTSYDAGQYGLGRRTGMTDGSGSTAWVHDALGRVLTETKVISGFGEALSTGYSYDRLDRVKTLTYPDPSTLPSVAGQAGETVTYSYNAQGLVESLTSSLGDSYLSSAGYSALDQPTQMALGNGVTSSYGYYTPAGGQAHFRLQTLQTSQGGVSLQDLSYTYDAVGNIETVDDAATGIGWEYFYDPLDRLAEATLTKPGSGGGEGGEGGQDSFAFEYRYDRRGNLTYRYDQATEVKLNLAYPTAGSARPHAPTTIVDNWEEGLMVADFDYDANGNRAADTERGITYNFDSDNRLVGVTGQGGATFTYDGDGQRTQRTTATEVQTHTTLYVGDYFETTAGDNWGQAQPIFGPTGQHQWWPEVVSDDTGQLYLVWFEAEENSGTYSGQLHFAMYDPLTQVWSTPETIPTSVQQFGWYDSGVLPSITVAPNGEVYVAWQENESNSDGIKVYRRTTGGSWAQDFANNDPLYTETKPTLAAAPDGTVYLAWQNEDDGTIQIRRRTSGGSWSTEPTIPQDNGYPAENPALAADSQSNILLAYEQDGLRLTRRDVGSGTWAIDPNTSGIVNGDLEVAIRPDDSLYIVSTVYLLYGFDITVDAFGGEYFIRDDSTDTSGDDLQILVNGIGILPDLPRQTIIDPVFPTIAIGEANTPTAIWQAEPVEDDPARLYLSVNQPQVTKHYVANGRRIATRVGGQLYYIHGDHLGSTSLMTNDSGAEIGRVLYSPYGSIITSTGSLATDRLYTGQRREESIDLYDYRARMYDPLVGSFLSPDSIVPEAGHPRGWNRYAYVFGNPVRYSDPTGHCRFDEVTGAITRFDCTLDEFDELPIEERLRWTRQFMVQVPGAQNWFNNIEGIIEGFVEYNLSDPGSWLSVVDASILEGIQDGYATSKIGAARGVKSKQNITNVGADNWQYFFNGLASDEAPSELISRWGAAERAVTKHGEAIAAQKGLSPNGYETAFLITGNIYRSAAATFPGGLGTPGRFVGEQIGGFVGIATPAPFGFLLGRRVGGTAGYEAGRFFNDPRSQIGGHSPVYWYSIQIWRLQGVQ